MYNHLEIETCSSCNRRCLTCLRQSYPYNSFRDDKTPVLMTTDLFAYIINQSAELGFKGTVCLQHFNEPLMDDRLVSFGKYVKEKLDATISFCSNMDFITESKAREIDDVFDTIDVALYIHESKHAEREEYLKTLFKKTKLIFTKGIHYITHYSPFGNLEGTINDCSNLKCIQYNKMLIVAYDGTVLHCCDDYSGHFGLGNLNKELIEDIWNSETHRKLINTLSKEGGRNKYHYCSICPRP